MRQVLQIGKNCWDIAAATETGLLIDGCDYYCAFYQVAGKAQRYILISGWQFDSDVSLVRGEDAREGDEDLVRSNLEHKNIF